jgi:glycosyltransferase 2 family protein
MGARLRRWIPALKLLLTLLVLGWVVWFFARILTSNELQKTDPTRTPAQILWDQACAARPGELVLAAALYLCGLAISGLFWVGLLRVAGAPLPIGAGLRAYYISQLGKYTPGMGLPTVIRMTLAAQAGVRPGTTALTAAYETLTTMAAGALVAAILIAWKATTDLSLVWLALGLLVLAVVPILPGVFNPLVRRLSSRFTAGQPLPHLPAVTLPIGLAVTACGWAFLGASLYTVVRALQESPAPLNVLDFLDCTAVAALSVVAGFLGQMPGGAGIREVILQQFLAPRIGGDARALVAALLLRLLWTIAEIAAAGVLFWLPLRRAASETAPITAKESGP